MAKLTRRTMLQAVGATAAAAFTWTAEEATAAATQAQQARAQAAATGKPYARKFFTAHEYATVTVLSNLIIPKDARSGSASDAGVPEFIDFIVSDQPARQTAARGGLRWLDAECTARFDRRFTDCTDVQRRQVLDDIAWPRRARPELSQGVAFFTAMRDLVATGFWSSRVGVADIGYQGNRPVAEWTGAPADVLSRLGVAYES
ncbi:MAG: gluconate 2-dehydrogenase subunit 3 family protein [Acidobacteria bacterium]|nr:gluconate 2-dehydrogenase subunit 3 family protein [Acidobacteriota bacterium]